MGSSVGRRCGSDSVWLWLWPAATAPIQPLAWEPPHAVSVALKSKKKKRKKKEKEKESYFLGQDSITCEMCKAEAGVEDWAEVAMARTVWKSLQEGPELPPPPFPTHCRVAEWTGEA